MKRKCGFAVAPYKGESHWKWKGGVSIIGAPGKKYRQILMPEHPNSSKNGKVLEHRIVMEKILGRYLEPQEKVHHINGNGLDNRPENLIVLSHRIHLRGHKCKEGANYSLLENKEWLASQFNKGLNTNEIASLIGCAAHAVRHALDRLGIKKIVSENGHIPQKFPQIHDREWLKEQTEKLSQRDIARMVGCNSRLIQTMQKTFGIKSIHKPTGRKRQTA